MLPPLNRQDQQAILHLTLSGAHWDQYQEYLQRALRALQEQCASTDDEIALRRLQGASQFLDAQLDQIAGIRNTRERAELAEQKQELFPHGTGTPFA